MLLVAILSCFFGIRLDLFLIHLILCFLVERHFCMKRKKRQRIRKGSGGGWDGRERSGGEEGRGEKPEAAGAAVAQCPIAEPGFLQKGTWCSETSALLPPPRPCNKGLKSLSP